MPVLVMTMGGIKENIRQQHLTTIIGRRRSYGHYIWSGQDPESPEVRLARIRADMKSFLLMAVPDIPIGAIDPYLDYAAAKIASETLPVPSRSAQHP